MVIMWYMSHKPIISTRLRLASARRQWQPRKDPWEARSPAKVRCPNTNEPQHMDHTAEKVVGETGGKRLS